MDKNFFYVAIHLDNISRDKPGLKIAHGSI